MTEGFWLRAKQRPDGTFIVADFISFGCRYRDYNQGRKWQRLSEVQLRKDGSKENEKEGSFEGKLIYRQ